MENEINIVDSILASDKESFMQAFNAAISNKVSDALEVKKVEIATTFLNAETETSDEVTGIETEVDGASSDAENFDSDAAE